MNKTVAHTTINRAPVDWSQDDILPKVSRTFALTIPQLPEPLRIAVTNAYLLCRITDTIEDDPELDCATKQAFHDEFIAVVRGQAPATRFAERLCPLLLSSSVAAAEVELVSRTPEVIAVTASLNKRQQEALARCVEVMGRGMPKYERRATLAGLGRLADLDQYCYYVAGVVGEMLTELFCDYSEKIAHHRNDLMRLAPSFGQGLQMTNILKDVWEDRQRQVCWLPRDAFGIGAEHRADLPGETASDEFARGMERLIAVARVHLDNALRYSLLIPGREVGIRRFCLWAVCLAVLTLRKIHNRPEFRSGAEVKVKRRTVKAVIAVTNLTVARDRMLRWQFRLASHGLPRMDQEPDYAHGDWTHGLRADGGLGPSSGKS